MKRVLVFMVLLVLASSTAHAVPCGVGRGIYDAGDNPLFTDCQNGPGKNDSVDVFNDNSFFGFDDWEYLTRQETPGDLDEAVDIDLVIAPLGGAPDGTWAFNPDIWDIYGDIAIVLKDGKATDDIYWSAYLLDTGVSSGFWEFDGTKNLSHLTVYARGDATPSPEPGTVFLLGAGLIGLAAFGRKKKA
jgi:hypothetical protein